MFYLCTKKKDTASITSYRNQCTTVSCFSEWHKEYSFSHIYVACPLTSEVQILSRGCLAIVLIKVKNDR